MTSGSAISRRTFLATTVAGTLTAGLGGFPAPAASQETPKPGGTLRVALTGGISDSLDPHVTQGQRSDLVRLTNLYDGLCHYTPSGTVELVMAESITPNDDATEWTVRLHQGIMTHDAREFLSDDLIFTVKRICDPALTTKGKAHIRFVNPDNLERIDDYTVKFVLDEPNGVFPEVWANRYLRMVPRGYDPANPVGTGPFQHQSFTPGTQSVFRRFDGYFRDKAWVDELVINNINDNTAAINALRSGQIDISYNMPYSEARTLGGGDVKILDNPSATAIPFSMRCDIEPFNDVRVRQAMRLIANREQMVAVALGGYGVVANDMSGRSIAPCGESQEPQRTQDIEEAKRLLAEAGRENLTVELVTVNGTAGMVEAATVFSEQAKAAGVTVNVKVLDMATYLANYGTPAFSVDWFTDVYLGVAVRTLLPGGSFNTSKWNDEEFNGLYAQTIATTDMGERCASIERMRAIERERGPSLIWGFANVLNGYRENVHGLQGHSIDSALYNLREAWLS